MKGNRAYYRLHRLLRSRRLRACTKCEICRTSIPPVVLYGHESGPIRAEDANALDLFERRILRTLFGGMFSCVTCHSCEGVRQRSPVPHKAQGSTANSMVGSGEARLAVDRVSTWMGGCSQGARQQFWNTFTVA